MILNEDIVERTNIDFEEDASKAIEVLTAAIDKAGSLKNDRVIRCIIYLAKGDLVDLQKYIDSAINDTRDVLFWAEYSGITEGKHPKQVRDFSKAFDKAK